MREVDLVLGNEEKLKAEELPAMLSASATKSASRSTTSCRCARPRSHMLDGFTERTRAFVQIQNGCDHRCTFCIIPFGRGNSRSVPAGEAVEQIRRLVANGYARDRAVGRRYHVLGR